MRKDWRLDGNCRNSNVDFFPSNGLDVDKAKQVCTFCPVKAECLEYALEAGEAFGVWGGTSERQRRVMRRVRKVG